MIAGIDYSTHFVDVVLLDEDTDAATWYRFELEGQDAFDRARSVRTNVPRGAFWDKVLAVGIEQPRGKFGVTHMMRIQGAVLTCIPADKLVHPLNPSDWRKTVGVPGNASKQAVQRFTDEHRVSHALWGGDGPYRQPPVWPQDACDAYCIALATRTLLQHDVREAV
jgi:hypothetical protein